MKLIRFLFIALLLPATFFTSCKKDTPQQFIIDAGPIQIIQLPTNTVTLTGSIESGQTSDIQFAWSYVSGPALPDITDVSSIKAVIDGLVAGTYVFQLEATNSNGLIAVDTVSVIVRAKLSVDAGAGKTIQLPTDTTTLSGTVISGKTEGMQYLWTVLSGPSVPVFANNTSASTLVSGLVAGNYVFQFQATDSSGVIATDTTTVNVFSQDAGILVLQPANNPYEGFINSLNPTYFEGGDAHQLLISAWTYLGTYYYCRTCIKFDYTGIPANATINSAKLYLYPNPVPIDGDKVNAESGSTNSCYIQRITSGWTSPDIFTTNNPPASTNANQAIIPQSTTPTQIDSVDVTGMVKDMIANGNNGFYIGLQIEQIYNIKDYASSYNSDPSVHPKLIINYQK